MKKYIILIPIYNDKESLTKLIDNINSEIKDLNSKISIIVINDASSNQIIDEYKNKKCDFITNTLHRTFPYGTEVEVFSFVSLEKAWQIAKKPSDREHVTPFIRNPKNKFIIKNIKNQKNISNFRYTVDKLEDLLLVKEIIKNSSTRPILIQDVIKLYKNKPEIFEINKNIKHDGYFLSLKKDKKYFKSNNNESP